MSVLNLVWVIGPILLLVGLLGGTLWYARRNRANDRVTEAATHELYEDPEHYEQKRAELEKQVRRG